MDRTILNRADAGIIPMLFKSVEKPRSPEYALVSKNTLNPDNLREASMAKEPATTEAATQETTASEPPAPKPSVQSPVPTKPPAKKLRRKNALQRDDCKGLSKTKCSTNRFEKGPAPKPAAKKRAAKPSNQNLSPQSRDQRSGLPRSHNQSRSQHKNLFAKGEA